MVVWLNEFGISQFQEWPTTTTRVQYEQMSVYFIGFSILHDC